MRLSLIMKTCRFFYQSVGFLSTAILSVGLSYTISSRICTIFVKIKIGLLFADWNVVFFYMQIE